MQLNRRGLVFGAASMTALGVSEAAKAAPYAWIAHHGMTSAQYQQQFNQATAQGYRPVHVDGYNVAGTPLFAAIWAKTVGGAWVARHDMTAAQYQQQFNQWSGQGYRLSRVSGYQAGGQALYAAIWEKRPTGAWVARHGMTSAQYQQTFNNLTGQGYQPAHVDGYFIGSVDYYAAIFEKPATAGVARHGLTSGQYQQQFDANAQQGYRLKQVSGYGNGNAPRFAALWDRQASGPWLARHNLTSAEFQQVFNDQTGQGYRLSDISGYDYQGADRYAAIFVKD